MATESDEILLTVFLKHDHGKTLDEINAHHEKTGFWREFPPQGVEVVSWYVMMGIGQALTERVDEGRALRVVEHFECTPVGHLDLKGQELADDADPLPVGEVIEPLAMQLLRAFQRESPHDECQRLRAVLQ